MHGPSQRQQQTDFTTRAKVQAPPQRFAVPSTQSCLCDDRQPIPGLRHLIGATVFTTCFCWRFAAVKHWPDARPGNTPRMLCTQRLR
ncbi:hypothetical protein N7454_001099 [Penicillium verhagenii]|nr:hypothetical protein N7454_001099 [Penicillium verhagenii]